jgi:hypothetical protein
MTVLPNRFCDENHPEWQKQAYSSENGVRCKVVPVLNYAMKTCGGVDV